MHVLLFGASGQVGRETVDAARRRGVRLTSLSRAECDLTAPGAGAETIERLRPDAVINAAAWTAVDKAETDGPAAHRLNAEAPGELAAAANAAGARFVHLSTDYVFDGAAAAPLDETAPTAPLNAYGMTKLDGERAVLAFPAAVVIRTSWVYAAHGANFVKTMLRLSETKNELSVVSDQAGGPTPAAAIAAACLDIATRKDGHGGLYHFQGAPAASWAEFAEAIFAAAGKAVRVNKILTREYQTPASRPLYTVLNCAKIRRDYGISQPDWRSDLAVTVRRLQDSQ